MRVLLYACIILPLPLPLALTQLSRRPLPVGIRRPQVEWES